MNLKHNKALNDKDQWNTDFPAGQDPLPIFCGERGTFLPCKTGLTIHAYKISMMCKEGGLQKGERKGSTFAHEPHKLVPKDKKTLSTKGSLKCSWQEPITGLLLRGRQLQAVQLFLYFVGYFLLLLLWKYTLRETLHCQRLFGREERTDTLPHIYTSWVALTRWQFPEAFFSPFLFSSVLQYRFYLIF